MNIDSDQIFRNFSSAEFENIALKIFKYQADKNPVYSKFLSYLNIEKQEINHLSEIPFLPVEFFKNHKVVCENKNAEIRFVSSGTTGSQKSKHYVVDKKIYEKSFYETFHLFYGHQSDYIIIALIPDFIERKDSSLVYMVKSLIELSGNQESCFYLKDFQSLKEKIKILDAQGRKIILIGLSYALIDFASISDFNLKNTIIMETGGMKGKREEIPKTELHDILKSAFGVKEIHSEYGMTELLSQAYSKGNQKYFCPPWMKIMIRDPYDPFSLMETGKTGGINIIDLANINSCSFIETRDLGKLFPDGSFEVLGRIDQSEIRGCNLMMD